MSPQEILDAIQADQDKATEKAKLALILFRQDIELRKEMDAMAKSVEAGIQDSILLLKSLGWEKPLDMNGMVMKIVQDQTFIVPPYQAFDLERQWAREALARKEVDDTLTDCQQKADEARRQKAGDN